MLPKHTETSIYTCILFVDKSKLDFLGIVIKRVGLLLKDKETTVSTPDRAKQWLTNDAASQAAVTKAGTFR